MVLVLEEQRKRTAKSHVMQPKEFLMSLIRG